MILVTGGTGLVGSHLLYDLTKSKQKVRAVIRNKSKIEDVKRIFSYYTKDYEDLVKSIDWVTGDMLDLCFLNDAFKEIEQVYHCAAIVAIGGKSKQHLIEANVTGTENIVNLCLEHKVKKLCHVSSIASLGNSVNGDVITENSKWTSSKNHSAYSLSKYKSEMVVWRGIQEGLNAIIVNPSVILGPGFWESGSGSLFKKAAKGMNFYTQGGTGFVDVRDVTDVMIKLMNSGTSNERFIINSENLSYKNLFDEVAELMQIKKPKRKATPGLLKTAVVLDYIASLLGIKKREITKELIRSSMSTSKYSNEKIINLIGITFRSVKESIKEIANRFNKELTIS